MPYSSGGLIGTGGNGTSFLVLSNALDWDLELTAVYRKTGPKVRQVMPPCSTTPYSTFTHRFL